MDQIPVNLQVRPKFASMDFEMLSPRPCVCMCVEGRGRGGGLHVDRCINYNLLIAAIGWVDCEDRVQFGSHSCLYDVDHTP